MAENNKTIDLSFEEARDKLVNVVQELEAGGLSLEKSLALWEEGQSLGQFCQNKLQEAQEKIEAVINSAEKAPENN